MDRDLYACVPLGTSSRLTLQPTLGDSGGERRPQN